MYPKERAKGMNINYYKSISTYVKPTDILFVMGCIVYYIGSIFEKSVIIAMYGEENAILSLLVKGLRYSAYLILIFKIVYYLSMKQKFLFSIAIVLSLLLGNFIVGMDKTLLFYFLLLFSAYDVNSDCTMKVFSIVVGSMIALYVILARFNVVADYILDKGTRDRHFLGFSWTTDAPILFLFISLCFVYIKKGRVSIIEYLCIMGSHFYFFKMTNTKLAFLVASFAITFFVIFKNGRFIRYITPKFKWLLVFVPFLMTMFSYIGTVMYNPKNRIWRKMDDLLTGRLHLGKDAIETYGITPFGNDVDWIGHPIFTKYRGEYNYVDSSYIRILVQFGVVILLLVLLIYSMMIYTSICSKKYYLTWILVFVCVFSVTEPRLLNLTFNPFPLIFLNEIREFVNLDYYKARIKTRFVF